MTRRHPCLRTSHGVGVAVALALLLAGCGGRAAGDGVATSASDDSAIQQFAPGERPVVGDFEGELLDGGRISSRDLAGAVAVVNVWGSWCGPCRVEAPALRRVSAHYRAEGVRFLGLNVRDDRGAAQAFERRFGIRYPSITSEDSQEVMSAFGGLFTVSAVPTTVVLDHRRRVAARVLGPVSGPTLRALVDDAVSEESSSSP